VDKDKELSPQEIKNYLDICVCANVRKASRVITRLYDDMLQATGVRSTQLIILMVVKHLETTTVSDLAEELSMDASTIARNLRPLLKMGYITMVPGHDRRKKMVSLTKAGHMIVEKGLQNWNKAQKHFNENMSVLDLEQKLTSVNDLTNLAIQYKNFQPVN
jgi:DNA-binding MarR family transcriptional regulator